MISVYITCKNKKEASKIAKNLLERKLIACANMFQSESIFKWKRKIVTEKEVAMLCKAEKKNFKKIEKVVKKLHSYNVPCIIAFNWTASSKEYANWAKLID